MRAYSAVSSELKGAIVVLTSFQLVHTLMEHDLVDELRLKIFPVVLGAGHRIFGGTSDKRSMRLVDTQTVDGDVGRTAPGPRRAWRRHARDGRRSAKPRGTARARAREGVISAGTVSSLSSRRRRRGP